MGEPIRLWDSEGNEVITYSPSTARAMLDAGLAFALPPAQMPPDTESDVIEVTVYGDEERKYVPIVKSKRQRKVNTPGGVL